MPAPLLALLALLVAAAPAGLGAAPALRTPATQDEPDPVPALPADTLDAYGDAGVRELLRRARGYRGTEAEGLESYEATFRERIYVGLSAFRFRRERVLYHRERAARIRWTDGGEHSIRWIGARHGIPVLGPGGTIRASDDETGEPAFDSDDDIGDEIIFEPAADRLTLGADFALHPLADTAPRHYRYRSGDTLRIHLPARDRPVTVVEVVVEPREPRFTLISGSLWLEEETGAVVRVVYRPSRVFDLDEEEPEDAEEIPGILKPVQAEIDFITLDYALYDMRWWLPRRIAFEGELRLGRVVRAPATLEWVYEGVRVNPGASGVEVEGPLPERFDRRTLRGKDDEGRRTRVTMIVPPADSLLGASELPDPAFGGEPLAFSAGEIDELREELEALMPGGAIRRPAGARVLGPRRFLRYNRVSGPSIGAAIELPTAAATLAATGRLGLADLEPGIVLEARREARGSLLALRAYRRLDAADDWGAPLGFGNSAQTLLFGEDDGHYFRATGAELVGREGNGRLRSEWRLFGERHELAGRETGFSLSGLLGGEDLRPNIDARTGTVAGASGRLRAQTGFRPDRAILSGTAWGEAGTGDFEYARLAASAALASPLALGLAGAVELSAGTTWGDVPPQRLYYLGGTGTIRGFEGGSFRGEAFWFTRVELANDFPGLRAVLFADLGWAGAQSGFVGGRPGAAAGIGGSILDGILRIDLARAFRGARRWRLHLYVDGIL